MTDLQSILDLVMNSSAVERVKLKDVCTDFIVPMRDKPKEFDGEIPWCRIEDFEGRSLNTSLSGKYVSQETIEKMNLKVMPTGTVICSCSASLGVVGINTQPVVTNQTFIGLVCGDRLINRYLMYYLEICTREFQSMSTTGTIPYISRKEFEQMVIPVPPIDVQCAIVEILDQFSHLLTNISDEVSLRDDQLITYSQIVLSSDFIRTFGSEPTVCNLSEVAKVTTGDRVTKSEIRNDVGYPVMSGGVTPMGHYSNYNREANTVTVVRYGSAGFVNWIDTKFWANDVCYTMECSDKVIPRYLYYALKVNEKYLYSIRTNAIPAHLQREDLESLQIFVPDIQTQQKIVNLLDSFHKLALVRRNELRDRLAQFEYYRDLILSFGGIKS